jgi:hypothetical protein
MASWLTRRSASLFSYRFSIQVWICHFQWYGRHPKVNVLTEERQDTRGAAQSDLVLSDS